MHYPTALLSLAALSSVASASVLYTREAADSYDDDFQLDARGADYDESILNTRDPSFGSVLGKVAKTAASIILRRQELGLDDLSSSNIATLAAREAYPKADPSFGSVLGKVAKTAASIILRRQELGLDDLSSDDIAILAAREASPEADPSFGSVLGKVAKTVAKVVLRRRELGLDDDFYNSSRLTARDPSVGSVLGKVAKTAAKFILRRQELGLDDLSDDAITALAVREADAEPFLPFTAIKAAVGVAKGVASAVGNKRDLESADLYDELAARGGLAAAGKAVAKVAGKVAVNLAGNAGIGGQQQQQARSLDDEDLYYALAARDELAARGGLAAAGKAVAKVAGKVAVNAAGNPALFGQQRRDLDDEELYYALAARDELVGY